MALLHYTVWCLFYFTLRDTSLHCKKLFIAFLKVMQNFTLFIQIFMNKFESLCKYIIKDYSPPTLSIDTLLTTKLSSYNAMGQLFISTLDYCTEPGIKLVIHTR